MEQMKFRVWDNQDYMSAPFTLQDLQAGKIQFASDCPVMEYTGLPDKNGKEICESDIVKSYDTLMIIMWNSIMGCWEAQYPEADSVQMVSEDGTYEYEVMGNIYQNPELLKEEDNG